MNAPIPMSDSPCKAAQVRAPGRRRLLDVIAALCVAAVALAVLHGAGTGNFDIDEVHKISEAYYFHLFFIRHDVSHPDWNDDFYARTNPPAAKYLMGALLALQGHHVADRHLQDRFEALWRTPSELKRCVPESLLAAARRVSVGFAALFLVAVFMIGASVAGRSGGLIAAGLMLAHPLFRRYCSLALYEPMLLFFLSSTPLLLVAALRQMQAPDGTRPRRILRPLLLIAVPGVAISCAAGVKLNGALAGVLWIFGLSGGALLPSLHRGGDRWKKYLPLALAAPILALVLFILLNPYLYDQPLRRIASMPAVYNDWMLKQAIHPGEALIGWRATWSEFNLLGFIAGQGRILPVSCSFPISLTAFLTAVGFAALTARAAGGWRRKEPDAAAFAVVAWILVYGIGILAWIPVDWDRYFLPLLPLQAVLAAQGVRAVLDFCVRGLRFRKSAGGPARAWCSSSAVIVAGLLATVAMTLMTDFTLLSPRVFRLGGYDSRLMAPCYGKELKKPDADPVRLLNAAEFVDLYTSPGASVPYYERALSYLPGDRPRLKALAASHQYRLASALRRTGQKEKSAAVLRQNAALIDDMARRFRSADPKVQEEMRMLAAQRFELSERIGKGAPER